MLLAIISSQPRRLGCELLDLGSYQTAPTAMHQATSTPAPMIAAPFAASFHDAQRTTVLMGSAHETEKIVR
jgi:hypothetical protein